VSKSLNSTISQLFSLEAVQDMAGQSSYSRGAEYYDEERVTDLCVSADRITAKVRGSRLYRVELWQEDEEPGYSCTCPFFQDNGAFCKHCVAVALACLRTDEDGDVVGPSKEAHRKTELTMNDVKSFLEAQEKASLVSLLLDHAKDDEALKDRLLMKASKTGSKVHVATFRKAIDRAVDRGDFVDYNSMDEYTRGIERVIGSLHELLEENRAAEVIALSEYFLERLESQMDMVDDSAGSMSEILAEVQELHHTACAALKPDPQKLAQKLFHRELRSDWEIFYGAVDQYADVLGSTGLSVYEELAEKEWAKLRPLGPGDERDSFAGNRFRIANIMERLAQRTGDVEKVVAVKKKNLSSAYSYLQIAELYRKAGRSDEALQWAEKGIKVFPTETDSRLREFAANEYHRRKRHREAMLLVWAEFSDSPCLESYKTLKMHSERTDASEDWSDWREKALQFIKKQITEAGHKTGMKRWAWYANDRSELVRIFLWEKNNDAAWTEAQEGSCNESLWLELAKKREADHPEDALAVYRTLVEPRVNQTNNQAYREAADLVKKAGVLFKRLGRSEEWDRYLANLREHYKRKRNFMAMLANVH